MQKAGTVLAVLRERGRKGRPCDELYRQMFSKDLYLTAYGDIYPNHGAMTPGADGRTADGMSEAEIDRIIGMMRQEKYRFSPSPPVSTYRRRTGSSARSGCQRGLTNWSGRQCACSWTRTTTRSFLPVRMGSARDAAATPRFPGRASTWTGTTWFIEA